ncbi:MAG: DNA-3-methyladenine glycosylase I [Cryomorphaceae bacterium]|jgi:DNA-3-methyladenine glycosylase I|nr:DNA-3-methyladenine glycosylase I [Cryomorphaceae bacterium]
MSYCHFCRERSLNDPHRIYHDHTYGFPVIDDHKLFGRLILEINQAGLSWNTILQKEQAFREAYAEFHIDTIAQFTELDKEKLLQNKGIIRNKLKIEAVIQNAKKVSELRTEYGSLIGWLDYHHPKSLDEWHKLFKKTFKFVGKEIVREFLVSTSYLKGAHEEDCPIYLMIEDHPPKWKML